MPNDNHMDAYRIYNLTVVRLFKYNFNLGPRATLIWHCSAPVICITSDSHSRGLKLVSTRCWL